MEGRGRACFSVISHKKWGPRQGGTKNPAKGHAKEAWQALSVGMLFRFRTVRRAVETATRGVLCRDGHPPLRLPPLFSHAQADAVLLPSAIQGFFPLSRNNLSWSESVPGRFADVWPHSERHRISWVAARYTPTISSTTSSKVTTPTTSSRESVTSAISCFATRIRGSRWSTDSVPGTLSASRR